MSRHTKEERYILEFYKRLEALSDFEASFDRYEVGESVGCSTRTVNAMVTLLLQANFFKKDGKNDLIITQRGITLANELLATK
jgi:hypothetical protein